MMSFYLFFTGGRYRYLEVCMVDFIGDVPKGIAPETLTNLSFTQPALNLFEEKKSLTDSLIQICFEVLEKFCQIQREK